MCGSGMRKGQRGRIIRVDTGHKAAPRLIEMGFTPGACFEVLEAAPLGDPLMLRIRGYSVAVRRRDLAAVTVEGAGEL